MRVSFLLLALALPLVANCKKPWTAQSRADSLARARSDSLLARSTEARRLPSGSKSEALARAMIADRLTAVSRDLENFLKSLPVRDTGFDVPQDWDQENNWHSSPQLDTSAITYFYSRRILPPDIKSMLARPLVIGADTVREFQSRRANGKVGRAICDHGKPAVMYGYDAHKLVEQYGYQFFRQHELGHISLGHLTCGGGRREFPLTPKDEIRADCYAKKALYDLPEGQRIYDRAWAQLKTLHRRASGHYPSTDERADSLDLSCDW